MLKYFLIFMSGMLLMLSISFYLDWSIEQEVLGILAKKVELSTPRKDSLSKIETVMNLSNYLVEHTTEILGKESFSSIKMKMISPSFQSFYYGIGACGTHTLFVARILKEMGFKTKIIQQKVNGRFGAHITLGVEVNQQLILIDPLFNCLFKDSAGNLSDLNKVAANWSFYKLNLPLDYDTTFTYRGGWRFTNWDKYGFISRGVYKMSCGIFGKAKTDNFSLRYYLLGVTKFYSIISLIFSVLILYFVFNKNFRQKFFFLFKKKT